MSNVTKKLPVRENFVTGYEICKLLKSRGIERKPQMIYNYIKNGLIKSEIFESQKLVRVEVANEWIEKFVTKNLNK